MNCLASFPYPWTLSQGQTAVMASASTSHISNFAEHKLCKSTIFISVLPLPPKQLSPLSTQGSFINIPKNVWKNSKVQQKLVVLNLYIFIFVYFFPKIILFNRDTQYFVRYPWTVAKVIQEIRSELLKRESFHRFLLLRWPFSGLNRRFFIWNRNLRCITPALFDSRWVTVQKSQPHTLFWS